jgi:UPF0716 protein FxsA
MLAFVIFIGLPILEIVLLVQAGIAFGIGWLLAWIIVSAGIGIMLVRRQGFVALRRAQEAQANGEVPVGAILTGIRLAFAGVFLIVPGFITDVLGLLLLLPWTGDTLGRAMSARVRMHSTWRGAHREDESYRPPGGRDVEIVDADFEVVSTSEPGARKPPANRKENPWHNP